MGLDAALKLVECKYYKKFGLYTVFALVFLGLIPGSAADDKLVIPSNYSINDLPPTEPGTPTLAHVSIVIMNIRDVKEVGEEISIEMNLRFLWKDSRLSESTKAVSAESKFLVIQTSILDKVWHPDIFIDHVKTISQPAVITKPASLRLYSDSSLRYSARLTVSVSCKMDFHYYPADTQRCAVDIKSYAYSDTKMKLVWRESQGAYFAEQLDLSNYFVGIEKPTTFGVTTTAGTYSGLRFTILLTRKLSYHMIQTYLPSFVLVIVSWLSFLVSSDSVPGRMTICMTSLLTLISMFAAVRQSTPNVSYVKAIDIWMVVCIFFVFLALMEFTFILKIKNTKPKKSKDSAEGTLDHPLNQYSLRGPRGSIPAMYYGNKNAPQARRLSQPRLSFPISEESEMQEYSRPEAEPPGMYASRPFPPLPRPMLQQPGPEPPKGPTKFDRAAGRLDRVASLVIPTMFFAFNFVYWPWLIACSEYYSQDYSATAFIAS